MIYLFEFSQTPFFDTILDAFDHFNFDKAAINFANGDLLALSPNNSYAPLYKYFLGVIYWLLGRNFYLIYSIQFAMGAMASVLIYLITRELFGVRAGVFAFLGFALYSNEIIYEGIILRAAFISFWGIASFYLLLRLQNSYNTGSLVLASLSLSLLIQARPNTILCLPFVIVFLHKYVFHTQDFRTKKKWLVFFSLMIISFIPLLIQCYFVHGRFVFFDANGPITFISGNVIAYTGVGYDPTILKEYAGDNFHSYGSSIKFMVRHILESPLEFLKLYSRKLYYFLNDYEVPSNVSVYLFREFSRISPFLLNHFAVFSSLGLIGIVLSFKSKGRLFLLYSFIFSLSLSVVIFLNQARYRIPVVPYFIIFSAYTVDVFIASLMKKNFKKPLLISGLFFLLYFFCFNMKGVQPIRIIDYLNLGTAYSINAKTEDDSKVYEYYRKAWNHSNSLKPELSNPELVKPYLRDYYLREAEKNQEKNNTAKRIDNLTKALYFDYSYATTHYFYAVALFNNQKYQEAFIEALKAVTIGPDDPRFHLLLGIIHSQFLQKPLWSLYHLKMAESLMRNSQSKNLNRELNIFRNQLKERGIYDLFNPSYSLNKIHTLLQNQIRPLVPFPVDLNLPKNILEWSSAKKEQYLINLHLHLLLADKANLKTINYQLGVFYLKNAINENIAYYYFEKAWEQGMQLDQLALLLNNILKKQAHDPIPWEQK